MSILGITRISLNLRQKENIIKNTFHLESIKNNHSQEQTSHLSIVKPVVINNQSQTNQSIKEEI